MKNAKKISKELDALFEESSERKQPKGKNEDNQAEDSSKHEEHIAKGVSEKYLS